MLIEISYKLLEYLITISIEHGDYRNDAQAYMYMYAQLM